MDKETIINKMIINKESILKEFDERYTEYSDGGINDIKIREIVSKSLDQYAEHVLAEYKKELSKKLSEHIRTGGDVTTTMLVNIAIKDLFNLIK